MNEFIQQPQSTFVISAVTKESLAGALGNASWSDTTYPVANKAVLYPFDIYQGITVQLMWWFNGRVVSGNVDCGVYDMGGALRGHTGATPQAGVNRPQTKAVNFYLQPGHYQLAIVMDNVTGQLFRRAAGIAALAPAIGIVQVSNNFPLAQSVFGLRNPMASASQPLFGLCTRSFL